MAEIRLSTLIKEFADRLNCGMDRSQACRAARLIVCECTDHLSRGGRIELRGFGSFGTKRFEARMARNPQNGEFVSAPARARVFFKAGQDLARRVDRSRMAGGEPARDAAGFEAAVSGLSETAQ